MSSISALVPRRPSRLQKVTPCNGCGDPGRYDGREVLLHQEGYWEWNLRFLCASCWLMLRELASFGDARPGDRQRLARGDF